MSAKKLKDNVPKMIAGMEAMAKSSVLVGIPSDSPKNHRDDDATIQNNELGLIMEFGAPEANIPPRPFLIPGVGSVLPEIEKRLSRGAKRLLTDPSFSPEVLFNSVGLMAQQGVQRYMTDAHFAPLADSTLAARQSRGFVGEKPLIVTGSLRGAITYVVERSR